MKAIFIKELRENGKWAALMLVAMSAVLAWGLSTRPSLVGDFVMPLITGCGFPVIGFALGLLQTLQDSSPGRWGFLTHRPITRAQILSAKLLAGICLYFLVALIPLGVAIYWVATPGHVAAPFAWQMTLPRLADAIGGLMWYAAGILVGARHARWIGSRLMPAGTALVGSIAALWFPLNMGEALLIFAIVLAIILPGAWAAFAGGEDFARQPIIARWTAGLCVLIGLFCALGALAGFSTSMLRSLTGVERDRGYNVYEFAPDGRMLIARESPGIPASVTDLQGKPLPLLAESEPTRANILVVSMEDNDPQHMSRERRRDEQGFQREGKYLRSIGSNELAHWYYVVTRNTIEGFNAYRREYIGSLGLAGFVRATGSPQPFPEPMYVSQDEYSNPGIVASAKTAYELDLSRRTIVPVFDAEPGDPILIADGPPMFYDPDKWSVPFTVVVTHTTVHVFESGKERIHTALKHVFPETISLEICRTSDGRYVLAYQSNHPEKEPAEWVDELDPQGRLLHETVLPRLPVRNSPSPIWTNTPILFVAPPAADLWALIWARSQMISDPSDLPVTIALAAFGLITLCATLLVVRQMGLSRRAQWAWVLFNGLLGFPGLTLLLSLFDRIAKIACPSCGKRRLVTREQCEHCNAPFARPAPEGIEVFASTSAGDK